MQEYFSLFFFTKVDVFMVKQMICPIKFSILDELCDNWAVFG